MKGFLQPATFAALVVVSVNADVYDPQIFYTNQSELPYYGLSPPIYPTPDGTGSTSSAWAAAYIRASAFVANLTLEEKVNLTLGYENDVCHGRNGGVPRLGFKGYCFMDGPSGIRGQEFVSAFPSGSHLAATWDRRLMYEYGKALGREERGKGVNVMLGPVGGPIGRVTRGGRGWEGPGPDPYLAGEQMGLLVGGVQEMGVIACSKHWLFNEQEYRRLPTANYGEAISSNVDDVTAHSLYIWPFMNALRAGTGAIMCSYQRANNSYACQNSKLLNGILKTELGFEGFVVSDWGGQQAGVASANAGLDIVMPNTGWWQNLTIMVTNGSVSQGRLDDMAIRTMAPYFLLGQDESFPIDEILPYATQHPIVDPRGDNGRLIREIGSAGTVLVKNINKALPLKAPKFVGVFGYDAEVKATAWSNAARFGGGYDVNFGWNTFNGTMITGGGSGSSSPPYVVSPFEAIQHRVVADNGIVRWDFWSVNPTIEASTEVCLVFINSYASESFDRTTLTDAFSDQLIRNVATNCSNTIVIIHHAGPRLVDAWVEHENVTAVMYAGLPGQESGNSLVDILYGEVNPSGKLAHTVAKVDGDYGGVLNTTVDFGAFPQSDFSEGEYIDYRYFDRENIKPRFEFGFGLSYTEFAYSNISVRESDASFDAYPSANISIIQGGHPELWDILFRVSAVITNIGDLAGAEISQLYLGIPTAPVRQLRGFDKALVQPGQTVEVLFPLTRRDLSVWDVVAQQWKLQRGSYTVDIGASSRDLRLGTSIVF